MFTSRANTTRRHERPQWAAMWCAMMCALLLVAPVSAVPNAQMRLDATPYQRVFSWLESAAQTDSQTRAAVLHTLCKSAGFDELHTARVLHSYQQWTQAKSASKIQSSSSKSPLNRGASTCNALDALELNAARVRFAPRDLPHTGRAVHSLAVCYLE